MLRKIQEKNYPQLTSTKISADLKEELNKHTHPKTVRRVLIRNGYKSRTARKKPLISNANKKNRLEFAKEYKNKSMDFCDKVLFIDECKFNIFQSDGRIRVWRKANTEFDKNNISNTVKHGGGGVMVWECMAASGVGNLVFIMDKTLYMNILKEKLNLGNQFYFQQGNDPNITAYDVRMWIIHHVPNVFATPPPSPDLNRIEHLWDELGRRVEKHNGTSKSQLKEVLQHE